MTLGLEGALGLGPWCPIIMTFRELVKEDVEMRIVDLIGHVMLGLLLGNLWLQFLPDILLPLIWLKSWFTGELLPDEDFILRIHKFFHTIWIPVILLCVLLFTKSLLSSYVIRLLKMIALQWFAHGIWDQFTHTEDWHKKALW